MVSSDDVELVIRPRQAVKNISDVLLPVVDEVAADPAVVALERTAPIQTSRHRTPLPLMTTHGKTSATNTCQYGTGMTASSLAPGTVLMKRARAACSLRATSNPVPIR